MFRAGSPRKTGSHFFASRSVLWGELTLIDENGEHRLAAGDFVGFPAGVANGHHLANRSAASAAFLMVGLRKRGTETLHYPDDELGVVTAVRDANGDRVDAQVPGAEKPADTRSTG